MFESLATMKNRFSPLEQRILKYSAVIFAISFIIKTVLLFTGIQKPGVDIVDFLYYANNVLDGLVPYKDFSIGFPPCSLIFLVTPGLISTDPVIYSELFALSVTLFIYLMVVVTVHCFPQSDESKVLASVIFHVIFLVYYLEVTEKFDIYVAFFTICSVILFERKQYVPAYILITFSALIKLYPTLFLLLFVMSNLSGKDQHPSKTVLKGIASIMLICAVAAALLIAAGSDMTRLLEWVSLQYDRNFQIESTVAAFILPLSDLGLVDCSLAPASGTFDIVSTAADVLMPYWIYVQMCAMVCVFFLIGVHMMACRESQKENGPSTITAYCLLLLLVFLQVNKVFSTQYIVWLVPFIIWWSVSSEKDLRRKYIVLTLMVFILSMLRKDLDNGIFHIAFLIREIVMLVIIYSISKALVKEIEECRAHEHSQKTKIL